MNWKWLGDGETKVVDVTQKVWTTVCTLTGATFSSELSLLYGWADTVLREREHKTLRLAGGGHAMNYHRQQNTPKNTESTSKKPKPSHYLIAKKWFVTFLFTCWDLKVLVCIEIVDRNTCTFAICILHRVLWIAQLVAAILQCTVLDGCGLFTDKSCAEGCLFTNFLHCTGDFPKLSWDFPLMYADRSTLVQPLALVARCNP